jgi:hypothetical protein
MWVYLKFAVAKFFHSSPEFYENQQKNRERNEKRRANAAEKRAAKAATKKVTKKPKPIASGSNDLDKSDADEEEDTGVPCSAYIHVIIPPPSAIRFNNKPSKPALPQIAKSGPLNFSSSLSHSEFLIQLAATTPCRPSALVQPQLRWKFEKPAKGDEKPLTGLDGYRAMIRALEEKSKERVIIISMPPPVEVKEHVVRQLFSCFQVYAHTVISALGHRGR